MIALEYQIGAALLLDLLLGDPRWLPHPVRFMGWLALVLEDFCRRLVQNQRLAGSLAVLGVLAITGSAVAALLAGAGMLHPLARDLASIYLLFTSVATRALLKHSAAVYQALHAGDLAEARQRVAMIVGRDTAGLDEAGVARAAVESVAESTVDGITAPLFFAALGGPLGAMLYKAVNTMDSTFGYKNERYLHFGWAAARLDDLANLLPARLTGLLVVAAARLLGHDAGASFAILRRDRLKHASPNSGHTEAAVAGALGIALGGANYYFGKLVEKPTIGTASRPITADHIRQANRLTLVTVALAAALLLALCWLLLPAA